MRLHDYRTLRPLAFYGRILGTGERLRLPEAEALPLLESGHIRRLDDKQAVVAADAPVD